MVRLKRRLLWLFLTLPALVLLMGGLYMVGMGTLEKEPRTLLESLQWAAETLTTTGYGLDGRWSHPAMALFAILVQFVGVFLVFLVFPIYLIPFLEERFETRLPRAVPAVKDHVVVVSWGAPVASLLERLRHAGVGVLIVEAREVEARRLYERGETVIHRPLEEGVVEAAFLSEARALIANTTDEENAAVILAARQSGFRGEILAIVEEPLHRRPIVLAGASEVYTPRHMLGAALAARASWRISPSVSGLHSLGDLFSLREVRIRETSPLAGKTLKEADVGAQTGAIVVGQWLQGELMVPATSSLRLEAGGILVAIGSDDNIDHLVRLAVGSGPQPHRGRFVVCGHGEVGSKVTELLKASGEETFVIDLAPGADVDLVGDALEVELLESAPLEDAQAAVVALDSDSATLFATVILKDLAPNLPVIARVNRSENLDRIHRAGAEFALSVSEVSAQVLSRRLLGEQAVALDPGLKVSRVGSRGLVGYHPAQLRVRQRTGCSIVGVERGGTGLVNFPEDFRFEEGDGVFVCGSSEAVDRFVETLLHSSPRLRATP
ncbi:MAG: NAD-binding protein [Deltaproteobacteria bacterium]|nr:NAD-binding protein [Deltaproteobacteria bacterium]